MTNMEKYLEEGDLSDEEIPAGLHLASSHGRIFLVVPAAAGKLIGIAQLMDAAVDYLPSPKNAPPVKGTVPGEETEVQREAARRRRSRPWCSRPPLTYVGKLTAV